jgi:hypothetical protein
MTLDPQKPSAVWQATLPWFAKYARWTKPIGAFGDQLVQTGVDALRLRYPSVTPDDRSLTLIGNDRRIPRAPNETPEAYARRLTLWLDLWGLAGLPLGLLYAIQSFVYPGYPTVRLVERSGLWFTLNEGASRDLTPFEAMTVPSAGDARYVPPIGAAQSPRAEFWVHQSSPNNWDWDSISNPERSAYVWDYWLEICAPSYPFTGEYNGAGDEEVFWGEGRAWGVDEYAGTIATMRELVKLYKRAGSECRGIVLTPSVTSLPPDGTPDATWPNGQWGADSVIVAGVATPTRNRDFRYILPPF